MVAVKRLPESKTLRARVRLLGGGAAVTVCGAGVAAVARAHYGERRIVTKVTRAAGKRADWIAVHTFSAVSGMSRCGIPYGGSAALTAFTRAGGKPMGALLPLAFTPSGLAGRGVQSRDDS